MSSLIQQLQWLGDGMHDDLSVAYDALEEIVRLRLGVVAKDAEIEQEEVRHQHQMREHKLVGPNQMQKLGDGSEDWSW